MKEVNRLTVSLKERMEMPFIEWGDKIKIKIVNMDEVVKLIREQRKRDGLNNTIQLIPSRGHKYFDPAYKPTFTKDPVTGIFYGIVISEHPDGNPKWLKVPLGESLTLNLDKNDDCKWWAMLRMHPDVNISPFCSDSPRYIVVDPEIDAKKKLSYATLVSSTLQKARTMDKKKLKMFARWCDIILIGDETPNMIRARLTELAILDPDKFQTKYADIKRDVGEIYNAAKILGLIKYDRDKGFRYENTFIGLTDFECVRTLEENRDIFNSMHNAVRILDEQAEKLVGNNDDDFNEEPV